MQSPIRIARRNIPPRTRPEIVAVLYPRLGSPGLFVVVVLVVVVVDVDDEFWVDLVSSCNEDIFFFFMRTCIEVSKKEKRRR